jgi:hypothetical protein
MTWTQCNWIGLTIRPVEAYKHFSSGRGGIPSNNVNAFPSKNKALRLVYSSKLAIEVKPSKLAYKVSLRLGVR